VEIERYWASIRVQPTSKKIIITHLKPIRQLIKTRARKKESLACQENRKVY
jgi:hypothetical protein